MESVGISEFKAKCIALMKQVQDTNQALLVTYRGKPLVRVEPLSKEKRSLGELAAFGEILGELVGFDFEQDWDMNEPGH